MFVILALLFSIILTWTATSSVPLHSPNHVLVIGSVNADIIIPIDKFPDDGETVVAYDTLDSGRAIAGGKGLNQAISCCRLGVSTLFVCQFGDDANSEMLQNVLLENNVDISQCEKVKAPSGLGLVFLQKNGAARNVVLGGANTGWPSTFDARALIRANKEKIACIMLQMEIPQFINEMIADIAGEEGIPVFQDVGGADREISDHHMKQCTYISPNLTELKRITKLSVSSEDEIIEAAKYLQAKGAKNVLVTLGDKGSLLLTESGDILKQPCCPAENVVDETGAGDNYRGAFVVSHFVDKLTLQESMAFASASSALTVTKVGAITGCSTREECNAYMESQSDLLRYRGGSTGTEKMDKEIFPYKFASRLNSMKDQESLWDGEKVFST
jgi:ribokinase